MGLRINGALLRAAATNVEIKRGPLVFVWSCKESCSKDSTRRKEGRRSSLSENAAASVVNGGGDGGGGAVVAELQKTLLHVLLASVLYPRAGSPFQRLSLLLQSLFL